MTTPQLENGKSCLLRVQMHKDLDNLQSIHFRSPLRSGDPGQTLSATSPQEQAFECRSHQALVHPAPEGAQEGVDVFTRIFNSNGRRGVFCAGQTSFGHLRVAHPLFKLLLLHIRMGCQLDGVVASRMFVAYMVQHAPSLGICRCVTRIDVTGGG